MTARAPSPNQRIEPMRRSAFRLVPRSEAVDALLLMAHPWRSATARVPFMATGRNALDPAIQSLRSASRIGTPRAASVRRST